MKDFIPFKEAFELKQLGFGEPCLGYYNIDPYLPNPTFNLVKPFDHEWCLPAPLYQQAFRWFREKYEIVGIVKFGTQEFTYNIYNNDAIGLLTKDSLDFNGTYEEAEIACLRKLIEIVKQKQ